MAYFSLRCRGAGIGGVFGMETETFGMSKVPFTARVGGGGGGGGGGGSFLSDITWSLSRRWGWRRSARNPIVAD